MKELAKQYLKKPHGYDQFRFSQDSNYITFDQWVNEQIDKMSLEQLKEYCLRNKLIEVTK